MLTVVSEIYWGSPLARRLSEYDRYVYICGCDD